MREAGTETRERAGARAVHGSRVALAVALALALPHPHAHAADAPPPTEEIIVEPLPIDAPDREALLALAKTLPRHGVLTPKLPSIDDSEEVWRKFGKKLLDIFAPPTLSRDAKLKLVEQARPLAATVDRYVPRHRRYLALQARLEAYAAQSGTTPTPIPDTSYKIRVGSTAAEIGLLRDRLRLEGYGDPNVVGKLREYWDDRLKRAYQAWQKDHGLPATVILDDLTRKRLNEPVSLPVADVVLALQRWRALDLRVDQGPQIFVDMTTFELVAERDGAQELQMPIVVGKATAEDSTPARTAPLQSVIVNPSWIVPARIIDEMGRTSPEALEAKGFEVTVDASGKWKVRMPPGPDNPLGKLKFTLEGTNGIYLHDTSARHLFGKADRTLSHGCVRLSQPEALAKWLLPDKPFDLENAMALPTLSQTFTLREPVPVHFVYQTIAIGQGGATTSVDGLAGMRLERRNDIYGRDPEALAAIDGPAIAAALRALLTN